MRDEAPARISAIYDALDDLPVEEIFTTLVVLLAMFIHESDGDHHERRHSVVERVRLAVLANLELFDKNEGNHEEVH